MNKKNIIILTSLTIVILILGSAVGYQVLQNKKTSSTEKSQNGRVQSSSSQLSTMKTEEGKMEGSKNIISTSQTSEAGKSEEVQYSEYFWANYIFEKDQITEKLYFTADTKLKTLFESIVVENSKILSQNEKLDPKITKKTVPDFKFDFKQKIDLENPEIDTNSIDNFISNLIAHNTEIVKKSTLINQNTKDETVKKISENVISTKSNQITALQNYNLDKNKPPETETVG